MEIEFFKYQGTGNDFIMIDGRSKRFHFSIDQIKMVCDRRFGIGADGLIILNAHPGCDFEMDYFNSDGSKSFCGNGSRCAQAFAKKLGMIGKTSKFLAIDGFHLGQSEGNQFATQMANVNQLEVLGKDYFIYTGSPHYIRYVADVDKIDVFKEGRAIRNSTPYKNEGTNVNFVSIHDQFLKVRTYERGVEAETYSCGTGVTAVAISYLVRENSNQNKISILTKGGELTIKLNRQNKKNDFRDIWLMGPAEYVFQGILKIDA